jgi:hypothetical protein
MSMYPARWRVHPAAIVAYLSLVLVSCGVDESRAEIGLLRSITIIVSDETGSPREYSLRDKSFDLDRESIVTDIWIPAGSVSELSRWQFSISARLPYSAKLIRQYSFASRSPLAQRVGSLIFDATSPGCNIEATLSGPDAGRAHLIVEAYCIPGSAQNGVVATVTGRDLSQNAVLANRDPSQPGSTVFVGGVRCVYPRKVPPEEGEWRFSGEPLSRSEEHFQDAIFAQFGPGFGDVR